MNAKPSGEVAPHLEALLWLGVLATYLFLRASLIDVPLDRDEGAFALVAQGWWRGEWPYREWFDHKPPGVFAIYALALGLFDASARTIHLFLSFWNFSTLVLLASTAARLSGRRAALWTGWLYAMASSAPSLQGFTASTEMLLLLPMVASLRLALAAADAEGARRVTALMVSGAVAAAACWIKQPAAVALLVVPLFLWVDRRRATDVGLWLAGGIALSIAVLATFIVAGAGHELIYWLFSHSAGLSMGDWSKAPQRFIERGSAVALDLAFPLVVALLGAFVLLRRRERRSWVPPVFLLLTIASIFHSPYIYSHYMALVAPPAALAGGIALASFQAGLPTAWRRAVGAGAAVLSAVMPLLGSSWFWWQWPDPVEISRRMLNDQAFEAAPFVAEYLRERMSPEDWMFIYGSEPQIPLLANRRNANPYVMIYPLTDGGPREAEFQQRTWALLDRVDPKFILMAGDLRSVLTQRGSSPALREHLLLRLRQRYQLAGAFIRTLDGNIVLTTGQEIQGRPLYQLWQRSRDRDGG